MGGWRKIIRRVTGYRTFAMVGDATPTIIRIPRSPAFGQRQPKSAQGGEGHAE